MLAFNIINVVLLYLFLLPLFPRDYRRERFQFPFLQCAEIYPYVCILSISIYLSIVEKIFDAGFAHQKIHDIITLQPYLISFTTLLRHLFNQERSISMIKEWLGQYAYHDQSLQLPHQFVFGSLIFFIAGTRIMKIPFLLFRMTAPSFSFPPPASTNFLRK